MRQKKMQCKDLPTAEVLFAMWAWHEEVRQINADRDPLEVKQIDLERVRQYPPDVVQVMMYLYDVPEKLVYAKLERKGLIEYGGTIRLGWPTDKGLALMREAGLVDSA